MVKDGEELSVCKKNMHRFSGRLDSDFILSCVFMSIWCILNCESSLLISISRIQCPPVMVYDDWSLQTITNWGPSPIFGHTQWSYCWQLNLSLVSMCFLSTLNMVLLLVNVMYSWFNTYVQLYQYLSISMKFPAYLHIKFPFELVIMSSMFRQDHEATLW